MLSHELRAALATDRGRRALRSRSGNHNLTGQDHRFEHGRMLQIRSWQPMRHFVYAADEKKTAEFSGTVVAPDLLCLSCRRMSSRLAFSPALLQVADTAVQPRLGCAKIVFWKGWSDGTLQYVAVVPSKGRESARRIITLLKRCGIRTLAVAVQRGLGGRPVALRPLRRKGRDAEKVCSDRSL